MTGHPHLSSRISFGDVMVQILYSPVVMALLSERLDQASVVASICRCHTIADLFPQILPALPTTARTKQIVVQLIVSCCLCSVKDSHGGSFQSYDNSLIRLIGENMSPQTVLLPSKVIGIVEATANILPFTGPWFRNVRICSHLCKCEDC